MHSLIFVDSVNIDENKMLEFVALKVALDGG